MKLTLLGTGTPSPSLKRASSGYLIEIGDDSIVMDHGAGSHQRLIESGRRSVDVTHVFFSHLHSDHCLDYPRLVLQRWDMGADRIPDLKVFGPPPLERMTDLLFSEEGAFAPDIRARIEHPGSIDMLVARGGKPPRKWPRPAVRELAAGEVVETNRWRVSVANASHMQPQLTCFGYRLDSEEGSICYSGDSGGVCRDIIGLARGADVLIHMTHFRSGTEPSPAYRACAGSHLDVATVAREAGVAMLVLSHMMEQIDQPGIREEILREMMAIYSGTIVWGEDLMEVPIRGARMARFN
jgi:ribonuclease BN (tRNA processing enzyme)